MLFSPDSNLDFRGVFPDLSQNSDDLQILALHPARRALLQDLPTPLLSRFHFETPLNGGLVSRDCDAMLTRYKLKHQKQWKGDRLVWEIATGQAKKCGIMHLSWQKESACFEAMTLQEPEPHFFKFLPGTYDREILWPDGPGGKP